MSFTKNSKDNYTEESWNIGMKRVNVIVDQEKRAGFSVTTTVVVKEKRTVN
jgi:hypothetical protein